MSETAMDPDVKRKWAEALRSGKYKQGRMYLCRGDKFCCLGVLRDVVGLEWHDNGSGILLAIDDENRSSATLLPAEGERIGLSAPDERRAWEMNDNEGMSFNEIADWVDTLPERAP